MLVNLHFKHQGQSDSSEILSAAGNPICMLSVKLLGRSQCTLGTRGMVTKQLVQQSASVLEAVAKSN